MAIRDAGQLGLAEETLLALYVGDFQKGLPAAIRAAALVPGLHLAAVGRSPVEPYREVIRDAGVADQVHLLPATPHVERCYAAADLFVFPTFYDPFGLVATEAMASGLPVVCRRGRRGGGADRTRRQWADRERTLGRRGAGRAPCALASDTALRKRLGEAGRRRVEAYTWDETAAADAGRVSRNLHRLIPGVCGRPTWGFC